VHRAPPASASRACWYGTTKSFRRSIIGVNTSGTRYSRSTSDAVRISDVIVAPTMTHARGSTDAR